MSTPIADAYSTGAAAWARGPMRIYGRLAELLVACSPIDLRGKRVLDHGAGTGAASRALPGSDVVAVDGALGMLQAARASRPPGVAGDVLALPFRAGAFDAVVAAFSLNHLPDPAAGVREAGRVARSCVLASTYAADDDHPVKGAVEGALREAGWSAPAWYVDTKAAMASWGTVDVATDAIVRGGLEPVTVEQVRVPFDDLAPLDLVRWRLGMAQCASFVASGAVDADALERRSLQLLGDEAGPLVRSVIFIAARVR